VVDWKVPVQVPASAAVGVGSVGVVGVAPEANDPVSRTPLPSDDSHWVDIFDPLMVNVAPVTRTAPLKVNETVAVLPLAVPFIDCVKMTPWELVVFTEPVTLDPVCERVSVAGSPLSPQVPDHVPVKGPDAAVGPLPPLQPASVRTDMAIKREAITCGFIWIFLCFGYEQARLRLLACGHPVVFNRAQRRSSREFHWIPRRRSSIIRLNGKSARS